MVLVTGGTGFLGAYIIKNLVEKGHPVRAIRRSAKTTPFIPSPVLRKVEWVEGGLLDVVSLSEAMQGVSHVVHAAAVVSFSKKNRRQMYAVNAEGTANLVNAALEAGVQRLLHVSSVAALGRTASGETVTEKRAWAESKSNTHYAISKHKAEMEVWRAFGEGLDGAIINPGTILGYGDWHTSSLAIFKNVYKEFPWYTNGINGFVGVEDVAEIAVRLLFSGITGQRFIVNSENWSYRQLCNAIADALGKKHPRKEATPFLGGIAWRLEALKTAISGKSALLTSETARVAQTQTYFSNEAILRAFPRFSFTPLDEVIRESGKKYLLALKNGELKL